MIATYRKPLTTSQAAVLEAIRALIARNGYSPSIREIGEHVGLTSTSTIQSHIYNLVRHGYVSNVPMQSRTLRVID